MENISSWKIYFTNKGQIRILRVCVIAALQIESSPKENPCTLFGIFGSGTHEGVPCVGVAEMVDVGVKNDLVRVHVVALKDVGESVVLRVEALVAPVGIDRSSRGRESVTRAAGSARGVRARGRTRARRTRVSSPRVSQQRGQLWLQTEESPAWVSAKARGVFERENLISCCTFSSVRE